MFLWRTARILVLCALMSLCAALSAAAAEFRGVITFAGLPLPGAAVTATRGSITATAISDENGAFLFDDLADGQWKITIEMQLFAPINAEVIIAPKMPDAKWAMTLLPKDQLAAGAQPVKPPVEAALMPPALHTTEQAPRAAQAGAQVPQEIPKAPEENEQSADGLLVQGSVNNAATSQYATNAAFGNARLGTKALYTGGIAVTEGNSALDARPFSLSGIEAAKPTYNNFTGVASLQGPMNIPRLMPRGPTFFVSYQWTRNKTSQNLAGLVPTVAERGGDLSGLANALGQPLTIYNPATGKPYAGKQVPVCPQAASLLKLYPLPNITNLTRYNYQAPVLSGSHQDSLQSRFDKTIARKDEIYGGLAFQSTRADNVNLFGFVDQTGTLGINANLHWVHRLKPGVFIYSNYVFSRLRTEVTPNFSNRFNVSGAAGIAGNNQDSVNWGPPSLDFSSGFIGLADRNSSFNRSRTDDVSASVLINRGKHNITAGGGYRKQDFNDFFQQNPRGTFTFTGAATVGASGAKISGSDLADFLIGIPDASAVAYGNADKYFRQPVYNAYINDDWRILPIITINAGVRWDYGAPITELFGRLVNLDVGNGFSAVTPVVGSSPIGPLTGAAYPASLIHPERRMIEPRIGISWRPVAASTIVIRAGYGIYPDTSVYQNIVLNMAQQAPLSKSVNVQNNVACPLSLANGFTPCSSSTNATFGIDPNFRVGYAQQWQVAVQRDLRFALQVTATYNGVKGSHGPQEFLPNSYPLGQANPCPSCPSGFLYETSGGNSIRNAGQLQLRRRLRAGFAAQLAYTFAKSIDDDAYLGGQGHQTASGNGQAQTAALAIPTSTVAQDWMNPRAERSLSSFDQRQLLSVQAQYTTGQGLEGGTLLGGWRGHMLKEWTAVSTVFFGTGLPETPLYSSAVPGTGFTSILRPALTGAPVYGTGMGTHLNAAAYTVPLGAWGNAGRNSLTGPDQFTLNSSLSRTFRPHGKLYFDVVASSTNTFNHVSFTSWNNLVTSTQFGLPSSADAMRSVQMTFHLRWQ